MYLFMAFVHYNDYLEAHQQKHMGSTDNAGKRILPIQSSQ